MNIKTLFILLLVLLNCQLHLFTGFEEKNDLIDYTFDLISKKIEEKKENVDDGQETNLLRLFDIYVDQGDIKKIQDALMLLKTASTKLGFLRHVFASNLIFSSETLKGFIPLIEQEAPSKQIILFNDFLVYSLRKKQISYAKMCFAKLKHLHQTLDSYDASYFWLKSIDTISMLIEHGLEVEAEHILAKSKEFIKKPEHEELSGLLIENALINQYIKLERKDDLNRVISKYIAMEPPILFSLKIIVQLLHTGYFKEANAILDSHCRKLLDQTKKSPFDDSVFEFIDDSQFVESDALPVLLLNNNLLKDIVSNIEQNLLYRLDNTRFESDFEFKFVNLQYIKFLVRIGFWEAAKRIAVKLDSTNNRRTFIDIFNYCQTLEMLPDLLNENFSNEEFVDFNNALRKKVSLLPNAYKLHIFLKAAHLGHIYNQKNVFQAMMDSAHQVVITMKQEGIKYPRLVLPAATQCALNWIEGGFPARALELIPYFSNEDESELILFRALQYYILHSDLETIQRTYNLIKSNSRYKNLAAAKIAAWQYLHGEKENALNQFRTAIKAEIDSNGHYLYEILKNYLSVKNNKLIHFNAIQPSVPTPL
jgi:hypothetical protein